MHCTEVLSRVHRSFISCGLSPSSIIVDLPLITVKRAYFSGVGIRRRLAIVSPVCVCVVCVVCGVWCVCEGAREEGHVSKLLPKHTVPLFALNVYGMSSRNKSYTIKGRDTTHVQGIAYLKDT